MNQTVTRQLVPEIAALDSTVLRETSRWLFKDILSEVDLRSMDPIRSLRRMLLHPDSQEISAVKMLDSSRHLIPHVQILNRALWSEVDANVLKNQPPASRLDCLSRFALFGFDLKIDPEGRPFIIEINGLNSGVEGFARSRTTVLDEELQERRVDRFINEQFDKYGQSAMAYVGTVMALGGRASHRLLPIEDLFKDELRAMAGLQERSRWLTDVHAEWHSRYYSIAADLLRMERALADKRYTDLLLEPWREFKVRSYPCTLAGLKRLLDEYRPELVVCKDIAGSLGEHIVVDTPEKICAEVGRPGVKQSRILEPFIPSQRIFSPLTKQYHDGCARYVIIAEQKYSGQVLLSDIGGYWRLAPLPISDQSTNSRVANLARDAQAIPLNVNERRLMSALCTELAHDLVRRWPDK